MRKKLKLVAGLILMMASTLSFAMVHPSAKITLEGTNKNGKRCLLEITPSESGDRNHVVMRARIGGPGIPFFLGNAKNTYHFFKMIMSDGKLLSMHAKADPVLEIFLRDSSELLNISSYKIRLGTQLTDLLDLELNSPSPTFYCFINEKWRW